MLGNYNIILINKANFKMYSYLNHQSKIS